MKVDTLIIVKILSFLGTLYPNAAQDDAEEHLLELTHGDRDILEANLCYLEQHEYITRNIPINAGEYNFLFPCLALTEKGVDFLLKDGGLTAIKNTVTVRFHADFISTIEKFILNSGIDQNKKSSLVAKLRELPFSATEHLMKKLLDAAVLHLPEALQLIEKALR